MSVKLPLSRENTPPTTTSLVMGANGREAVASRRGRPRSALAGRVLAATALALFCLIQLVPFWITVTTSVKGLADHTPQLLLPTEFDWSNFVLAIEQGGIFTAMRNSIIVTAVSTALTCLLAALAAYPLARRATRLNRYVYAAIVALIMVPPLSILVPLYTFLVRIGATNTYWGEILVMTTTQLPLALFLYASFIRSIPISLEEAAALDGAGPVRTFFQIVLPLLKPVTATVLILSSVSVWNEYALSSFLLRDPEVRTIAPSVASFFAAQGSNLGAAAAAALIAVMPILIAYLFLQRYFIKGMLAGAEK